jgi:L-alanine-DL-glutamate epimerase-like enolase superfamily enzyme
LWDLKARRSKLPLHQLAGGAQERVPLYTTEGGWLHLSVEALVDDALTSRERGFGGSKIKVGRPLHEDIKRLCAVKEAVGESFHIMIDANQGFTVDEAIRRAPHYAEAGAAWYEEPLPAEDLQGHVRLCRATTLPIAIGESLYHANHFRDYMARDGCSIIQADVARVGGITPWLKTAHTAESFNLPVCPHFLMELHVALTAAVPNGRWVEYIPQLDPITEQDMKIVDGFAVPSTEAGLGIAWDWQRITKNAVAGSFREFRK